MGWKPILEPGILRAWKLVGCAVIAGLCAVAIGRNKEVGEEIRNSVSVRIRTDDGSIAQVVLPVAQLSCIFQVVPVVVVVVVIIVGRESGWTE